MSDVVDVAAITTQLYNILKPLSPIDRKKVVKAALTLLDDNVDVAFDENSKVELPVFEDSNGQDFLPKVRSWMQKSELTPEHLASVFHIDGDKFEIIASDIPGKNGKEKTINAYILIGIGNFIVSGEAKFQDKDAREACAALGVYNGTNHATYMKDKGNVIGGSKSAGWTITTPGFKSGVEVIKVLASA